jgi:dienelactone hydrolase
MFYRGIALLITGMALCALPLSGAERSFDPAGVQQDFAAWQEETRAFLAHVLYRGDAPEAVPLETEFGEKETRGNYELTKVSFHDRPGHVTTGWLARPVEPAAEKVPAVISLHGHGGTAYETFDKNGMYFYGHMLASRGYMVLALDINHYHLDHVMLGFIHFYPLWMADVPFPHMGQRVWMTKRAIDLLETIPEVDAEKIAVVGLSNGGMTSMFAAAADERIKLCVASGALITYDRMWHSDLIHCRCQYMRGMEGILDYYDVFALIAPRPLVVQGGEKDPIFPIESAKQAFTYINKAYQIAGVPERVIHDVHTGAHVFSKDIPLQRFEKYLPMPEK